MSSSKRKIGNYSICFEKYKTNDKYFDRDVFVELLGYVKGLDEKEKIINIKRSSKAVSFDSIIIKDDIVEIVFKNCKYNHSPEYMSSQDGSERPSDKALFEGDKEVTHLLGILSNQEITLLLEERKVGVSIGIISDFLNRHLGQFLKEQGLIKNFKIIFGVIPKGDFNKNLKKMNRVKVAEVYTYKKILGSEELNLLEKDDFAMRDDILVTMKSKPTLSLGKQNLVNIYNSITGVDEVVSRIRIYGETENGNDTIIDSNFIKKTDFIEVELKENGVVNTTSMFSEMKNYMGV